MVVDKLSLTEYVASASGATDFTSVVTLDAPSVADSADPAGIYQPWRWVRVQAHDALLLVTFGNQTQTPPDPDAGSVRVNPGTVEVFQVTRQARIKVLALSGSAGSVQWGR